MEIEISGLLTPKNTDVYRDYRDVFPNISKETVQSISDEVAEALALADIQLMKLPQPVAASEIIARYFRAVDLRTADPTAVMFKLYILGTYIGYKFDKLTPYYAGEEDNDNNT